MRIQSSLFVLKQSTNRQSFMSAQNPKIALMLIEMPNDSFEKFDEYKNDEDDEILAGPYGHPYSGRPIINSGFEDSYEKHMSFIDWLLDPERKMIKRPKLLIERIFSLGNDFNDDVSAYHKQIASEASKAAKGLVDKHGPISIPIGDLNGDGVVDKIISGINRAIDLTGDGKVDIVGTLIDIDGDGKADFVRDALGNLIEIKNGFAQVIGDSGFKLEDLKVIPEIVKSLLEAKL